MISKKFLLQIALFAIPLVIVNYLLDMRLTEYSSYEKLGLEDAILEDLQIGFLFLSAILGFVVSFLFLKKKNYIFGGLFILIGLTFIVVGGEELSWGQRVLEIETPEYLNQINRQQELNLHNIGYINDKVYLIYRAIALYATFAWILLIFFGFRKKDFLFFNITIVPWYLTSYFVALYINFLEFGMYSPQDYEVAEFLAYMGIMFFMIQNYFVVKKVSQ